MVLVRRPVSGACRRLEQQPRDRRREGKKGHEKRKEGKWEEEKKLGTKGRGKAGRGEEMRRRRSGEEII